MSMSKRGSGAKRTLLITLCCLLAVVLAVLLVVTIVANHLLDQVQHPADTTLSSSEIEQFLNENTATGTGPTVSQEDITFGTEPTEVIKNKELINILLIGQNADSAEKWQKSEVMILCTVNKETKTVTMTSFLRDMYVQIPGHGNNKLNVAYTIGGMKLLDQTLEENFGVKIDGNIAVNYTGFMLLVNKLGGVKIDLTPLEANYLNTYGNWGVTHMYGNGWNLKEGENHLTGSQTMGYSMIKKLGGETARTERQRKVIAALIERAKNMSLKELYDVAEEAAALISTDLTNDEIMGHVAKLAPMLTDFKIVTQCIPVEGSYSYKNVSGIGECAVIDFDANRKALAETLKP